MFRRSGSVWWVMCSWVVDVFSDTPTREPHDPPSTSFWHGALRPLRGWLRCGSLRSPPLRLPRRERSRQEKAHLQKAIYTGQAIALEPGLGKFPSVVVALFVVDPATPPRVFPTRRADVDVAGGEALNGGLELGFEARLGVWKQVGHQPCSTSDSHLRPLGFAQGCTEELSASGFTPFRSTQNADENVSPRFPIGLPKF